MASTSCSGFLDQNGIWNNGFDCPLPRICCGTETDRYCCIPIQSILSTRTSYQSTDNLVLDTSNSLLSEKWFLFQICAIGIFLAIVLFMSSMVCQCFMSMRRNKQRPNQRLPIVQMPLPVVASPLLIQHNRSTSNRISTISSTPSDVKSRYTDVSMVFSTPLNLYPTVNSRHSTLSSYYMFSNEFEQLCK